MKPVDDESTRTSRTLLKKVVHWEDHPAWVRFRDTYDPRLRRWCRRYGLDDDAIDEVCQRVWWELADRMRTFEYDPGGSFRGWLRRLCESRVLNYLRERHTRPLFRLDDREDGAEAVGRGIAVEPDDPEGGEEGADPARPPILEAGEAIQSAVRARVKPHNWEAFWLVAIGDWSVERTAEHLGMSRAAVYAARERVARMLRDEGRRLRPEGDGSTSPRAVPIGEEI